MCSTKKLVDEGYEVFHAFNHGYFNKKSIAFICHLLVTYSLKSGNLEHHSLNKLKEIISNHFSNRSIDFFVKILSKFGILQKKPRKKQQAYKLEINNSLLRFFLAIYYPDYKLSYKKNITRESNLSNLIRYKSQLERSIYPVLDKKSYITTISETVLGIIESCNSVEEIKESIFEDLVNQNSSKTMMDILTDINHSDSEDG